MCVISPILTIKSSNALMKIMKPLRNLPSVLLMRWMKILPSLVCYCDLTLEPKATEYVSGMISMISALIEKGFAYTAANGDVYLLGQSVCRLRQIIR